MVDRRWMVGPLVAVAACLAVAGAAAQERELVAEMETGEEAVRWKPAQRFERVTLTVSGPGLDFRRDFEGEEAPVFALAGERRERVADGGYSWELRAVPVISADAREKLRKAREVEDRGMGVDLGSLEIPRGTFVQAGFFTVRDGRIVRSDEQEPEGRPQPGGRTRFDGDVEVEGDLRVRGTKAFVATDPAGSGASIVYVALEGPEAGTYLRGTAVTVDGTATIELPEHFAAVTELEGLTVQLTPQSGWSRLYVAEKSPRRLVVHDADSRSGVAFDYLVQGVRKGYAGHRPERAGGGE